MNSVERFLAAACGGTVDRPPVWLMRQAGRYLPEYQTVRRHASFVEMCKTPNLAVEVSLQPWRRFGMDAVIFFSDILFPCEAMGLTLSYHDDSGPRLGPLPHTLSAVHELRVPDPAHEMPYIGETLQRLRATLQNRAILIGFGGAPWTLATYVLAGGSTTDRGKVKELLSLQPELLHALLDKITETGIAYLQYQMDAGAQAIQVFDSWAGTLTPEEYEEWALPYTQRIFDALRKHNNLDSRWSLPQRILSRGGNDESVGMAASSIPLILFCQGGGHLLPLMDRVGADVLSIDANTAIAAARAAAPNAKAIQGNLSPALLREGPMEAVVEATRRMLGEGGCTGYIANLGHGVLKETPVEHVKAFVEAVKLNADV